jgi:hypothetical protein
MDQRSKIDGLIQFDGQISAHIGTFDSKHLVTASAILSRLVSRNLKSNQNASYIKHIVGSFVRFVHKVDIKGLQILEIGLNQILASVYRKMDDARLNGSHFV